jgi:UDP-N-acetylglucosamine--dolichyl-phosphate N-acetylglucosaminephosphotransferase
MVLAVFAASLLTAIIGVCLLKPRLQRAGIVGRDMHKQGLPEVAEMGGLAVVAGGGVGISVGLAMMSFFHVFKDADVVLLLAAMGTILLTALIGFIDDLLGMEQWVKAFLPAIAALPLVAVRAGHTWLSVPYIGRIDFWIFYPLFLVPTGVMVAANAVNMLAGFNGMEAGMGLIAIGSLAVIAAHIQETTALIILLSGAGALLGVLLFNWYPAKILIGDVGTLTIGAIIATGVIVGNFETAGVILLIPYAIDFLFKAANRFPSKEWWGKLGKDGKLRCPHTRPVSLCQCIMKMTGGIKERNLTLSLMGIEAIFGGGAILLYFLK